MNTIKFSPVAEAFALPAAPKKWVAPTLAVSHLEAARGTDNLFGLCS